MNDSAQESELWAAQGTPDVSAMNSLVSRKISSGKQPVLADLQKEFDFRVVGDGRSAIARYANNSNYRNDSLIRKESRLLKYRKNPASIRNVDRALTVCVSSLVVDEIKQMIKDSEIMKYTHVNPIGILEPRADS
jgi:hypothetical protein